jgi:hypothetical protein
MEVSGQLHAPAHFTLRERASGTHWIGGWMCPRADTDMAVKREIPSLYRESYPSHPARSPGLYLSAVAGPDV